MYSGELDAGADLSEPAAADRRVRTEQRRKSQVFDFLTGNKQKGKNDSALDDLMTS